MAIIYNDCYTVYAHINKINGKIYIGITCRKPELRWGKQGSRYKDNQYFYSDIQKYGWDNFDHEIIASNLTKQEAENFERLLISSFETYQSNKGYNLDMGGTSSGRASLQTREKQRIAHLGKKIPVEQKEKIGQKSKEMWEREGFKESQSETMKKFWADEQFRANMKEARKNCRHDTRNVGVIYQGKTFRNVKDFSEFYHLNRYTVNNWLNGNNTMPLSWWENGLRNQEDSRNEKIRPRFKEKGGNNK